MHMRRRRSVSRVVLSLLVGLAGGAGGAVATSGPAAAVEGSWAATGALNTPRIAQRATLLKGGKVLLAGGRTATEALTSAELYNPLTELFTLTGSMTTSRWSHTATLLPDGRVLVAGGFTGFVNASNAQSVTETAELYDPATGTWTPTGPMNTRRALHAATLLADGRVLVAGGRTCTAGPPTTCDFTFRTNSAEIFDPATGTWTAIASMNMPRHTTSAVRLLDGRVIVPAGFGDLSDPRNTTDTADVYDPATGNWALTDMQRSRARQGAMLLPDGDVLVGPGSRATTCGPPVCENGGPPFSAVINETTEIFDADTNTWQLTNGLPLVPGRFNFQQAVLPNGKALIVGGFGGPAGAEALQQSAEVYDPATGTWDSAGSTTHLHASSSALANTHDAVVLSANPFVYRAGPACGANCGKVLVLGDNLTDPVADLYTPEAAVPSLVCTPGTTGSGSPLNSCTVSDADGLRTVVVRNLDTGQQQFSAPFNCATSPTSFNFNVPANTRYRVVVTDCSQPRRTMTYNIRTNGTVVNAS